MEHPILYAYNLYILYNQSRAWIELGWQSYAVNFPFLSENVIFQTHIYMYAHIQIYTYTHWHTHAYIYTYTYTNIQTDPRALTTIQPFPSYPVADDTHICKFYQVYCIYIYTRVRIKCIRSHERLYFSSRDRIEITVFFFSLIYYKVCIFSHAPFGPSSSYCRIICTYR